MNKFVLACSFLIVHGLGSVLYGQDIPVGTWRMHISYNNVHSISVTPTKIYAAASTGIMVFDPADNSISTITKLDGLSSTVITQLAFDQQRNQLLVAYADGDIDIIKDKEIINFNTLRNSTTISGTKRINHISIRGDVAYFSTDYGVVVFDLIRLAVKETWRDLGVGGSAIKINQSTFYNDSVFLATQAGVLAGDLDDNLLDYSNWKRFNAGIFNNVIPSVTTFTDKIYAAINGSGIYEYENGVWQMEPYLPGLQYKNLTAGEALLVTTGVSLHKITGSDVVTDIISVKITRPYIAFEDPGGKLWIGDEQNGLVSDKTGSFESYAANGPTFSRGLRLKYDHGSNTMFAVSGGFSNSLSPLGEQEYLNSFSAGVWKAERDLLNNDLTDVELTGNKMYLSSCGYGLQSTEAATSVLYDETNSPLDNVAPGRNVRVTTIAASAEGLWVTNAGASESLHLLKSNNTWESFSFPAIAAARYPTNITIDYLGNVWMILNPSNGGGILVFDKSANKSAYLTDVAGSGGLPDGSVYSIAMDRDGFVWIGTGKGVAYFPDPSRVFSAGLNAIKPVFENRFLLRDEKITAIEVDGGNRKWIGTENGLWLFNSFGEKQVYNFNTMNSPILSNRILDLEINNQSGELFLMTDLGIISFRSDATEGSSAFNNVKIFPNPVTAQFNGQVGISGLVTNAIVKITDVAGKLVWQSQANGGSVSWNVRDYNGTRVATGMYLVFCIAQDGSESMAGKIAVVD